MTIYGNIFYGTAIYGLEGSNIQIGEIREPPISPGTIGYRQAVRLGDICSCGASIITGCSMNTFINSRPAALMGAMTSHNSMMLICSAICMVNTKKLVLLMDMHSGCPIFPPHPPSPVILGSPNTYAR
jgi:hypothetical protein